MMTGGNPMKRSLIVATPSVQHRRGMIGPAGWDDRCPT
jgi:hypothetical protein